MLIFMDDEWMFYRLKSNEKGWEIEIKRKWKEKKTLAYLICVQCTHKYLWTNRSTNRIKSARSTMQHKQSLNIDTFQINFSLSLARNFAARIECWIKGKLNWQRGAQHLIHWLIFILYTWICHYTYRWHEFSSRISIKSMRIYLLIIRTWDSIFSNSWLLTETMSKICQRK